MAIFLFVLTFCQIALLLALGDRSGAAVGGVATLVG